MRLNCGDSEKLPALKTGGLYKTYALLDISRALARRIGRRRKRP